MTNEQPKRGVGQPRKYPGKYGRQAAYRKRTGFEQTPGRKAYRAERERHYRLKKKMNAIAAKIFDEFTRLGISAAQVPRLGLSVGVTGDLGAVTVYDAYATADYRAEELLAALRGYRIGAVDLDITSPSNAWLAMRVFRVDSGTP